eukprot:scaffold16330_cov172-Amphora_coffeaeformis.AAC.18
MKKGAVLKALGDFEVLQFIIHAREGALGALIVKHECPQPKFRERLKEILASPDEGNFHRFEGLDSGKLGDRLGLRIGDIYVVYRDGGFALGTLDDLNRDLESGNDFALNVLRDTKEIDEFEKCDDFILNEDEDSITSTESESDVVEETTKRRSRSIVEEALLDSKCVKEVDAGIPGYRVLEYYIKDHFRKPFGAELIQESVPDRLRKQMSHFLDPTETIDTLSRFYHVVKDQTPCKDGIRQNDILLNRFKATWLLGTERALRSKITANRPFRIHVMRKDYRVGPMNVVNGRKKPRAIEVPSTDEKRVVPAPRCEKQLEVPAIDVYSSEEERDLRKRRRSNESEKSTPADEKKIAANERKSEPPVHYQESERNFIKRRRSNESEKGAKVIMQVPGHRIWKAHVKESEIPFGADLVEEKSPPDFLGTMLGFFPAGSNQRCRFAYIEKGLQADTLGLQEGDILINSVKSSWQLGSKKDFEHKINRDRGFYLYYLRKCPDLESRSLEASALGYGQDQQKPTSVVRRRLKRLRSHSGDIARVDSKIPESLEGTKSEKASDGEQAAQDTNGEEQPVQDTNGDKSSGEEQLALDRNEDNTSKSGIQAAPSEAHEELKVEELQRANLDGSVKGLQQAILDGSIELDCKEKMDADDDTSMEQSQRDKNEKSLETEPSSLIELFNGLNLSELLQYISKQDSGAAIRSVFDYVESLLTPMEIEKFVCLGGLCHTFLLLTHRDEEIQTLGWRVVLGTHSHMPQCHSSLVALGIYQKLVHSLQECETGRLFETLVEVLVSPIVGTETSIQDFVVVDGAVASLIMAIDRRLGSTESYISCCRFMANVLASHTIQS